MRKTSGFAVYILVLALGWFAFYEKVQDHFSDRHDILASYRRTKESLQERDLEVAMLRDQFQDYQQEVAAQLPARSLLSRNPMQLPLSDTLRVPASVTDSSQSLFDRARRLFRDKKYTEAISAFDELIVKFPASSKMVESRFLRAESLYLMQKDSEFVESVQEVVGLYPENELTGFLLLRLAELHLKYQRKDDAKEVYEVIQSQFQNPQLTQKAAQLKTQLDGLE